MVPTQHRVMELSKVIFSQQVITIIVILTLYRVQGGSF